MKRKHRSISKEKQRIQGTTLQRFANSLFLCSNLNSTECKMMKSLSIVEAFIVHERSNEFISFVLRGVNNTNKSASS